jgi:acetyltransferase-like isoleucine patch superfamily enzyme
MSAGLPSNLTDQEMVTLGLAELGNNVRISRKASLYGASRLSIGSNVRIDDFVVISAGAGGIKIGSHVHIAVYTCLIGAGRIELGDFANLSSRVSVYSSSDDFSGNSMTSPVIDERFTNVTHLPVTIGRHTIIGTGSAVMPGAILGEGVAVGALSLVKGNLEPLGIFAGCPARKVGTRTSGMLRMEEEFLAHYRGR